MNSMMGMNAKTAGHRMRGSSGSNSKSSRNPMDRFPDTKYIRRDLENRKRSGDVIPNKYKAAQLRDFSADQLDLFRDLFQHTNKDSYLSRLASGDESYYDEMEQPAWRQFQEAQGQLGSRYSQFAPGALGAQRGSGFQNTGGQQASDYAMNLKAQRQGIQRQAISDLAGLSNTLLQQRPYQRMLVAPRQKGESGGWIQPAAKLAGKAVGSYFGQPSKPDKPENLEE